MTAAVAETGGAVYQPKKVAPVPREPKSSDPIVHSYSHSLSVIFLIFSRLAIRLSAAVSAARVPQVSSFRSYKVPGIV